MGSFNSVGTPRADGKIEIDPRIHSIMQTFGAQRAPGMPAGATPVKSLIGIPFDVQPIPVKVSKRSISREMAAGQGTGGRGQGTGDRGQESGGRSQGAGDGGQG